MHPELFTIPGIAHTIKSYGFALMIGFLTAVWFAMRRSLRVKANPDIVLNLSFVSLICGVAGARLFFVIHYWQVSFARQTNHFLAIIDLREGGLEFLGGLLGAFGGIIIYLALKKESIRLYLDILAPGAMWGLAFGRIGCFLNGCCFGGLCDAPWAVSFPFGSPAHVKQWENRQVHVPAELVNTASTPVSVVSAAVLNMSDQQRRRPERRVADLEKSLATAKASDPTGKDTRKLEAELAAAKKSLEKFKRDKRLRELDNAQLYPSRVNPARRTSVSELEQLAAIARSLPVHPTQLYSAIHAFLLSGLLSALFYRRKRHGMVIGVMFLFYPVARVILETIRIDNPHDTAGLTVSQFLGLVIFFSAAAYLFVLYRYLPERSRYAVAYVPPQEPDDK